MGAIPLGQRARGASEARFVPQRGSRETESAPLAGAVASGVVGVQGCEGDGRAVRFSDTSGPETRCVQCSSRAPGCLKGIEGGRELGPPGGGLGLAPWGPFHAKLYQYG